MLLRGQLDWTVAAATSKKWIEAKMKELHVTINPDYKLCMLLDDLAMITVDTPTYGVIEARMNLLLIDGLMICYCRTLLQLATAEIINYFCEQVACVEVHLQVSGYSLDVNIQRGLWTACSLTVPRNIRQNILLKASKRS